MKYKLILKRNIKHNYSEALDIDALKKLQKYRGGSHVVSNFIRDYRHDNNTKFFDLIDIVDRITKSKLRSVSGKDRKILRDLVLKKGVDDSKKHCSDIIYDDVMSKVASSYTLSGRFDDEPLSRFNPVTGNKKKAFSTAIKTGSEDALMGGYHNTSSKNRLKKFIRSKIEKAVDNFFKKSHLDESTNYSEAFDKDGFDWVKEKSNTSGRWAAKYLSRKKNDGNIEFLKFKKDLKEKRQHMSRNEFKNYLDNLMFDLTNKKANYGDVDFRGVGGLRRHFDTDSISKDTKAFRRFVKSVKAYGDSLLNPDLGLVTTFQKKLGKELKHNKDKIDQLQFNTTEGFVVSESYGKYGDVKSIRPKKKPKRRKINSDRFDYKIPKSTPTSIRDQNPTSADIVSTNTTTDNALSKLINKSIVTGITGDPIQLKKSISFFNSLKNEIAKVVSTNKNSRKYPMLKSMISSSDNKDPEFIFKSLVQKPIEYVSDVLSVRPGSMAKGKAGKDIRRMVKVGDQLEQSSGQSKSTLLANLNKILQSL